MNQTKRAPSDETTFIVKVEDGTTWIGTEAQLRHEHPKWIPYAKLYVPEAKRPASQERHPVRKLDRYPPPASPHRVGHYSGTHPEDQPYTTGDEIDLDVGEPDEPAFTRSRTSIKRYDLPDLSTTQGNTRYELRPEVVHMNIPPRRSAPKITTTPSRDEDVTAAPRRQKRRFRPHRLLFVGIGAIVTLLFWYGGTQLGEKWQDTQNDWTYTQAFRTFSIDAVVGHNHDSAAHPSHFIVQNDKRHLVIIEFPADDMTKALIYPAPYLIGQGQDRTPVTISFQENLQTGKLDMVLHVEDQTYLYLNNGTKFVPQIAGQ